MITICSNKNGKINQRTNMIEILNSYIEKEEKIGQGYGEKVTQLLGDFIKLLEDGNYEAVDCDLFAMICNSSGDKTSFIPFTRNDIENEYNWDSDWDCMNDVLINDESKECSGLKRVGHRIIRIKDKITKDCKYYDMFYFSGFIKNNEIKSIAKNFITNWIQLDLAYEIPTDDELFEYNLLITRYAEEGKTECESRFIEAINSGGIAINDCHKSILKLVKGKN